ncbi:hypothetical protein ONZ45_g1360 [Pleurotus djamor]|nr:hypothetical protein ONZ45_g1360 [Pleurotus djamor]
MAVASSRRDSASSKWWSLAPKNSPTTSAKPKEPAAKSQSASKFNTLASAIGFKSKKHPSLAIQEPPYLSSASSPASANPSPIADSPNRQVPYINRPPSKSVSSTKSPVESIEPITPIEPFQSSPSRPHHRQSLFTLSDSDPFASHHGIQIDPQPPDPSRLSVYSGSSASDYGSKKFQSTGPNRTSYASSSFSSAGEQLSPTRCIEPIRSQVPKLKPRRSQGSLHRKVSLLSSDSALTSAWESLTHSVDGKRPSTATSVSSIVVDPHRRSQPPPSPLPRPPMRARGLTDVGLRQPSSQPYPDDPSPSPLPFDIARFLKFTSTVANIRVCLFSSTEAIITADRRTPKCTPDTGFTAAAWTCESTQC